MQFSEKIIAARRGKGMSQEALAEAVGVSRQAVSKWETGEAKPDLDKLIGLCNALDLDMGYLCLGKTPAPPPASEKKRPHPAIIAAVLLSEAVLFFLLGMGACYVLFSAELSEASIDIQPSITQQQSVSEIEIVNVSLNTIFNDRSEKRFQISVMTNTIPEGLQVRLLVENRNFPSVPASTYDSLESGSYYRATIPHTDGQYTITAILTLGSETKQIPLLELDIDGSAYSHNELWK